MPLCPSCGGSVHGALRRAMLGLTRKGVETGRSIGEAGQGALVRNSLPRGQAVPQWTVDSSLLASFFGHWPTPSRNRRTPDSFGELIGRAARALARLTGQQSGAAGELRPCVSSSAAQRAVVGTAPDSAGTGAAGEQRRQTPVVRSYSAVSARANALPFHAIDSSRSSRPTIVSRL